MSSIVAHSFPGCGGRDLYHGCPDLKGGVIKDVSYKEEGDSLMTCLQIEDIKGFSHTLVITAENI